MNKITVKITQQFKALTGFNAVFGAKVALETKGTGTSAITATNQAATIEFFEEGDKKTSVLTFASQIKDDGGLPQFDMDGATITEGTNASDTDTDFFVELEFDTATFKKVAKNKVFLRVPFDKVKNLVFGATGTKETAKVKAFRIAAQVTIAGTVESAAFANAGDAADMPIVHVDVADRIDSTLLVDAIGLRSAYPLGLLTADDVGSGPLLTPSQTIPKGSLTVVLTDVVTPILNGIAAASLDLAVLGANLTTIFKAVFPSVSVRVATAAEMALWQRDSTNGKMWSAKVAVPLDANNSPTTITSFQTGNGVDLPFFQFFVDANNFLAGQGDELADASTYDDKTVRVKIAGARKKVINPIILPSLSGGNFHKAYKALTTSAEQMAFLADLVAHEIGHDLGLRHVLAFDGSSHSDGSGVGLMHALFVSAKPTPLRKLGPIHEALLKKHFP